MAGGWPGTSRHSPRQGWLHGGGNHDPHGTCHLPLPDSDWTHLEHTLTRCRPYASATATTQPGIGPAPEFSSPYKQPASAAIRQPGLLHQEWAHNDYDISGPRDTFTDGRARAAPWDAMLHPSNIGRSPTVISPARTERDHDAWNCLLASRKVRLVPSLPLFPHPLTKVTQLSPTVHPSNSPRAKYQQKRETSSYCHAATASPA